MSEEQKPKPSGKRKAKPAKDVQPPPVEQRKPKQSEADTSTKALTIHHH